MQTKNYLYQAFIFMYNYLFSFKFKPWLAISILYFLTFTKDNLLNVEIKILIKPEDYLSE